MPSWSEIRTEIDHTRSPGASPTPPDFDGVRRKYLHQINGHTGRNVILYASAWLQKPDFAHFTSIMDEDMQGFMEVVHGLDAGNLDLILHSPGGFPDAAAAIVFYLRSRFDHIRVFVPHLAMSAATMIACAADEIWLGNHSFLGPTDPQLLMSTPLGGRHVSALDILAQFDRAREECKDPSLMAAWVPMLGQYGPDLLASCETAYKLSKELVRTWLEQYMFKGCCDRAERATEIADWLANRDEFKSHARHIPRPDLEKKGMVVRKLEDDHKLQDLILSVFHATTHAFVHANTIKIIENHQGRAFIKNVSAQESQPT